MMLFSVGRVAAYFLGIGKGAQAHSPPIGWSRSSGATGARVTDPHLCMMGRPTRRVLNLLALGAVASGLAVALLLGAARLQSEPAAGEQLARQAGLPRPAVIAHRGASFWAPEATRPAYLLARELGADYLEVDLQRTRDRVLIAMHDRTPARLTDVARIFPGRATSPVEDFTFAELRRLDAGAWFNVAFPERARSTFRGLRILRLEEVLDIAEGRSPAVGVYIELKRPQDFPGIAPQLLRVLAERGWIEKASGAASPLAARADAEHTHGRIVFQSFDRPSLVKLKALAPGVPRVLLLSEGRIGHASWKSVLDEAAEMATGVGPWGYRHAQGPHWSQDAPTERYLATWPWHMGEAHRAGLLVHPWTIDDAWEMWMLRLSGADGLFTNRPGHALHVFGRADGMEVEAIWDRIGY